jgi:hypothetical protein
LHRVSEGYFYEREENEEALVEEATPPTAYSSKEEVS